MSLRPFLLLFLIVLASQLGHAQQPAERRTWREFGGSPDNAKYMTLDQITKANVSQLQVAWTYPTQDDVPYIFNPLIVDNTVYVLARNYSLVALDATTGKEIWVHEGLEDINPRGISYWESQDRQDRRLIFQANSFLQALDARTGKSILTFGKDGVVNLREGLDRDPAGLIQTQSRNTGKIFENLLIMGSVTGENFLAPPGYLRAYDVVTGRTVWTFHTVPHPGEFGYDTWPKDAWKYAGGTNTWGEITIDTPRGIAYFPTGSSTYDLYGADRHGNNLFANSLIALDARTGKRLWHFQMVHHDLWDWDNSAAPVLTTIRRGGRLVDVVAQAGKTGFLYVFDRVSGEPIWPIEERPVPPSDLPGEKASPTQPFPTAPPPFARQTFTADDLNPFILTPEQREHWRVRLNNARGGRQMFTPPSATHETIVMPGTQGGANVGTTASHPSDGTVYVLGINLPSIFTKMSTTPPTAGAGTPVAFAAAMVEHGGKLYVEHCQVCHGSTREGVGGAPSLIDVALRMDPVAIRETITGGRGAMPSIDLNTADLQAVFTFLASPVDSSAAAPTPPRSLGGPVVASGGAPAGRRQRPAAGEREAMTFNALSPAYAYPPGVVGADLRYYGSLGNNAILASPPYATITRYDLNTGTIKWQIPSGGDDARAVLDGARDTGFMQIRTGMIITSTGLLFQVGGDAKLRVYDTDTGKLLWITTLPGGGTRGLSSMYEVNGRQYLVVNASTPPTSAVGQTSGAPRGYVAFALPVGSR